MPWNKKPKIVVQEVIQSFESEPVAYYAKGRFSPGAFLKAVEEHSGKNFTQRPKQEFWLDAPGEEGSDLSVRFFRCGVFDKGAYAVTVVDLKRWER